MKRTKHFQERMSQRGVSEDMVKFVLKYGTTDQDKYVLARREALMLLDGIRRQERVLKKILDKGGVVVVAEGNSLITTYNYADSIH
ncbi:MAG TPA: DUF4258 domain-containing protein [Edaphobacter sp.]|nr:DUF4258 domain-containing protein [Edaphobacter sp.]